MMLLLPIALAQSINITHFGAKLGIFFEKIGTTQFTTSDWTIEAYDDLKPYWQDMKTMGTKIMGEKCQKYVSTL